MRQFLYAAMIALATAPTVAMAQCNVSGTSGGGGVSEVTAAPGDFATLTVHIQNNNPCPAITTSWIELPSGAVVNFPSAVCPPMTMMSWSTSYLVEDTGPQEFFGMAAGELGNGLSFSGFGSRVINLTPRANVNRDAEHIVDMSDLLSVISAWGKAPDNSTADVDRNGVVDTGDLLSVIRAWN